VACRTAPHRTQPAVRLGISGVVVGSWYVVESCDQVVLLQVRCTADCMLVVPRGPSSEVFQSLQSSDDSTCIVVRKAAEARSLALIA
jgi:hypothetical protein